MKRIGFLFLAILFCCNLLAQNNCVVLDKNNVIDCNKPEDWTKVIQDWDYAALETKEECTLGNINKIYFKDEYVFVNDIKSGNEDRLLVFKETGEFLRQIGSKGNGKEQHGGIGFVNIDLERNEISLYDGLARRQYFTYDLEGNFIKSGDCGGTMFYARNVFPVDGNKLLGYCACGLSKMCYFISDNNFTKYDTLRRHKVLFPIGVVDFSVHPVSVYNRRISMLAPLCDTIFEYRKNRMEPRFITKVHRSMTDKYELGSEDYLSSVISLRKEHGCFSKNEIYETRKWFVITYWNGKMFYHKNKGKAYFIPKKLDVRGDLIYPKDLWGQVGEKLIAVFSPEELLDIKHKMEKDGVEPTEKVKNLFNKVKKGGNPWLFYYSLK